jgi:hypothetical protein
VWPNGVIAPVPDAAPSLPSTNRTSRFAIAEIVGDYAAVPRGVPIGDARVNSCGAGPRQPLRENPAIPPPPDRVIGLHLS